MKTAECELHCPKCKKHWADMKYNYGEAVSASDITIVLGKKKKLKDGESLACSGCSHEYTSFDVMLAIAEHGKQNG